MFYLLTGLGIILTLTIVIIAIPNQTAEAVPISLKGKGLGIIIEKPLILSGKLRYADLIQYDNSSRLYSGDFVKAPYNDIKRGHSKYENSLGYYITSKKLTIFIDPPRAARTAMPTITIVSNLAEFHDTGQFKILENKTVHNDIKAQQTKRTYSTARFVDDGCYNAIIQYQDWKVLLDDTIQYLAHDCDPKYTKIKTTIDEFKPITKHDIGTSGKAKLDSFYEQVKNNCTKARNSCSVENKQVSTMRDTK